MGGVLVCCMIIYGSYLQENQVSWDGEIRVHVGNAPPQGAIVRLAGPGPGDEPKVWTSPLEDGHVAFGGLRVGGHYTLAVGPNRDGLCAWRDELSPGDDLFEIDMEAGLTIRGRILLAPGAQAPEVLAVRAGIPVRGVVNEDGTYEISGLADGLWQVRVVATLGDAEVEARADVAAGGEADLEIR
jgi:hypothetical protein